MPTFAVDSPWVGAGSALGTGIGALFSGEAIRQKAMQDSMGKEASMYMHKAAGDKYRAEAALDAHRLGLQQDPLRTAMIESQVPLDARGAVERFMQTGNFGPEYQVPADGVGPVMPAPVDAAKMSTLARAIALMDKANMTKSNVQQMAQAGATDQRVRDQAAVIDNPALALPTSQAYFATSGKAPFDNVNNTGYSVNGLTGDQVAANPALAKLFGAIQQSVATENNAQAGNANASAGLHNARRARVASGLDKPVTIVDDATGQATVTAIPTNGAPVSIGVAAPKGSGTDATNAKTRNQVIKDVEKDNPGASEDQITAEVNKRLARRGMGSGNKNPANPQPAPTMDTKTINGKTYVKVDGKWYEK